MLALIGLAALYATGHMFALQIRSFEKFTQYEKIVSIAAMVFITLIYIGLMTE